MEELGAADPRQIGRYRIIARLGAGGMGRVYLGRSTSGRMVAVKVVRAELAEDPDFRRRFAREVEAARRVTGFFTAAVVDADPGGVPPWLATAYVPGLPLDAAIRAHGAWPRHSLLVLGAGLAEALEAIHGTRLIHRDLKPSNVLLAADGPRVIDFGISVASEASLLTQTGMVIGTPGFMSPEQVTGRTVGPASDVFSLGAVLAFAGTGAAPFGTGSPHSVNFRAVYEQPDLQGLPAGTEFVGRCLEKDPERRPTVQELLTRLAQLLGEQGVQTYGGRLPKETDWLPEAVALALTDPTGSGPAPLPTENAEPWPTPPGPAPAGDTPSASEPTPEQTPGPAVGPVPTPMPAPTLEPTPTPVPPPTADQTVALPPLPPTPPTTAHDLPGTALPARPPAEPMLVSTKFPASPSTPPTYPTSPTHPTSSTSPTSPARLPGRARIRRLVAMAVAAVLVTGGGVTALIISQGKDNPGGAKGGSSASAGAPTGPSDEAPKGFDAAIGNVVNASDKKGGTLRLASGADADSWDPARSYYGWVWNFQRLYTRALFTYDVKPGKQGLTLVPDLASAKPQVSADGRTYTVRLKPGLKFEDGTAITSKDVKYGIERVFAQDVLTGGPTYLIEALDQGQNYRGPYKDGTSGKTGLKAITTPDDLTLVFRLAKPDSRFPYVLAMGATSPVPQSRDTGAEYGTKPVSSGPYRFESYTPGKSLLLVRNDHWNRSSDPLRKALPDRVELSVATDADRVAAQVLEGTADLDVQQAGLSPSAASRVLGDPKLRDDADAPANGFLRYVSLVSTIAPLDNAHCRKAVLYAADTNAFQNARGGPTSGSRHGNMLPPVFPGADAYDPFALTSGKPQPEKAKEELRACGKPKGFSTKLLVRSTRAKEIQSAEALRQALRTVGIAVEIERLDTMEFLDAAGSPSTVRSNGYGLMMVGWGADFPQGSSFLQPLADGRLILPAGNSNHAQINDLAINALFDQAEATTDAAEATELYRRINHKVTDGAYYLPVAAEKTLNYRNPRLTNVYVHQAYGMIDFQALGTSDGR